jgi:hypothetical protein|tara:strand:+ start:347 stop:535 length:189 start_codon:yes stop_codon:yes gene_type:complete
MNDVYFDFLDELRSNGTINMMGAPRELRHKFGMDKIEAIKVFVLWTEQFSLEKTSGITKDSA